MSEKTDKELADELDARDRLRKRGYKWERCPTCNGLKENCFTCKGRGGIWEAPLGSFSPEELAKAVSDHVVERWNEAARNGTLPPTP